MSVKILCDIKAKRSKSDYPAVENLHKSNSLITTNKQQNLDFPEYNRNHQKSDFLSKSSLMTNNKNPTNINESKKQYPPSNDIGNF